MGRRAGAPSKGDRREQALLDAAEVLLEQTGLDRMTVDAIARGAGISRGSMYFYFGSKHEVLAALVRRTMTEIRKEASITADDLASSPVVAMERAVKSVEKMWRDHGTVMRAAVEYGTAHSDIGTAWDETVELFAATMRGVLARAGVPDGDGPQEATALARALCWMTERTFYQASRSSDDQLARAVETSIEVWRRFRLAQWAGRFRWPSRRAVRAGGHRLTRPGALGHHVDARPAPIGFLNGCHMGLRRRVSLPAL